MKILHTSDWHIGRKIEDKSLESTLEMFFEWLQDTISENKVDVLIVAGDIFNNPFPGNTSLELYYRTLLNLSKTCLKHIIITGGNHDSVSTLNAPKQILRTMNIDVIGGVTENIEDMIIEIKNKENEPEMVICAVPFLREKDIRNSISGDDFKEKIKQISDGISNFYKNIGEKTAKYKELNIPIVATGHLFVNDVNEMSAEEKDLFIGGLQQLSFKQIPDIFDYVALGHIHKPMRIGKKENVRYCGSPIQMNFSEVKNKNQVVIVDFDNSEPNVEIKYVPIFRKLLSMKGTLSEIQAKINEIENTENELIPWASIEIIEETIDPLMEIKISQLREDTKNVEIIKLRYSQKNLQSDIEKKFEENVSLKDLKPTEIFENILTDVDENQREELMFSFNELLNNYLYEE